jgi:hypothetical protein
MVVNMNTPAFPAMHYDLADNEHGLTMRDYFAAKAMQTLAQKYSHEGDVSRNAYKIADAMLKAREA